MAAGLQQLPIRGVSAEPTCAEGLKWIENRRPPTNEEAMKYFKINGNVIGTWWRQRASILEQPAGTRRFRKSKAREQAKAAAAAAVERVTEPASGPAINPASSPASSPASGTIETIDGEGEDCTPTATPGGTGEAAGQAAVPVNDASDAYLGPVPTTVTSDTDAVPPLRGPQCSTGTQSGLYVEVRPRRKPLTAPIADMAQVHDA